MSGASKTSASATYQDSFITRLDLNGNILGSDQFGVSGNNNTVASDIAFDDSGNYYVAGSTTGALDSESHSGNSKKDMFIRKYNSSNVRQWTKLIGNSTHDQGG
ncbi:MAG: SBBP repeat-containing protein, partial [Candidatus Poseidoniales archaeon]